jgi:hypothetical protein
VRHQAGPEERRLAAPGCAHQSREPVGSNPFQERAELLGPSEEHAIVIGLERQQAHVRAAAGDEGGTASNDRAGPDQRAHSLRPGETAKRLLTELDEIPALGHVVTNQRGDGLRQQDLPAGRQPSQSRRAVDGRPEVVAVALMCLSHVDAHANLQ